VIRLRSVRRDDAPCLVALLDELGYPTDLPTVHARLDYWLDDPSSSLLGAEDDGELIAVAALHVFPVLERTGKFGRLLALVVDHRYQGQGVGGQLVQAVEERARDAGCTMMEVTSSRRRDLAHRFYQGLGYEDICASSARFTKTLDTGRP